MAETKVELQHGMRVRVKGTLYYNGRVGTLLPNSGDAEDFWNFNVELDATTDPEVDEISRGARIIGVYDFQVEPV